MIHVNRRAGLVWPAVITVALCAILVGLGVWQLQRRTTKQALIATIAARAAEAPQALPDPAEWPRLRPQDYEYRHVAFEGTFEHDKEALVFRASGGTGAKEPGYLVLTPMRLASGATVVVNRGFVPEGRLDPMRSLTGTTSEARITGLMRAPEPRNLFTPTDDPSQNRYYTRDPATIAAHWGLRPAAPFSIDADASDDPGSWPRGGAAEIRITNNHLGYALTWFALAAAAAAIFGTYARSRWRD